MEWCKTDNGKYRIESLSRKTFEGALEVIRKYFCQHESACIGCEVNLSPAAAEELLELCADAALDGVSLVAINEHDDSVAAVAFNKLQVPATDSSEKPYFEIFAEERCTQPESRSLVLFMVKVDEKCNLFEKYNADCSFEIMFLATATEHRSQGLGKLLCKISLDVAKQLKYGPVSKITLDDLGPKYSYMKSRLITTRAPKICQAIWTSFITQKIGKSLGFEMNARVSYDDFEYNGKTFAERIGPANPNCELNSKII